MSRPERDRAATHPAYPAYRLIKQQNTFAFYTSRAGMIETLDYRGNSYNACSSPPVIIPEHQAEPSDAHRGLMHTTRSSSAPARAADGPRWSWPRRA